MEPLLIPLLILAAVVVIVLFTARRFRGAERQAPAAQQDPRELAREASRKLTAEQHRALYSLIAQEQLIGAIKIYREATGVGLRAAKDTVLAMVKYPQPYQAPRPAAPVPEPTDDKRPEVFGYRYRAIASRGETTLEVSSNMLNDQIYGHIRDLAQAGEKEEAARLLVRHSTVSLDEARDFIALL
ncbi:MULTISPECIES: hypothetical protein [Arthrobacter]|uniref:Ribosomal protein L7/L12 C-terminal domain-containing protein n=2 Tax=Arthrobacter TaxID=1663 RepID=A0ABU9KJ45_9MICC|nr:hypothetical protein [Arthrobacter sp. YJM1]MDP5226835.1 hypothetical protein [Arthrobacter sp. YJM1]